MYKLINHPITGEVSIEKQGEQRLCIPFDPQNTDYQGYLKWVSEGNTPYPADSAQPLPADGE